MILKTIDDTVTIQMSIQEYDYLKLLISEGSCTFYESGSSQQIVQWKPLFELAEKLLGNYNG